MGDKTLIEQLAIVENFDPHLADLMDAAIATIEQLTQDLAGAEDALSDLENLHLQMIAERDELQPKADAFDVLEGWQKTGAVRKLDSVRLAQYRGVSLLTAIQQAEGE